MNLFNYHKPYAFMEKGKALYGVGRYEEAIACFKQMVIADYVHHPFDLSIFYEKMHMQHYAILALGEETEAKEAIHESSGKYYPDASYTI